MSRGSVRYSPWLLMTANIHPTTVAQPRRYFVNAPVDFALIGGLSILAFLGLRYFTDASHRGAVSAFALVGMWVCNWPHFAATNYRLYHTRANIQQYPMTALVVPWLIVVAVAAAILYPTTAAPYFVKVFLIWSPYHFSAQSVGVTLIYARRNGFHVGRWDRLALSTFIFSTFISQTLRAETNPERFGSYFGIPTPSFGLPTWAIDVTTTAMWIAGALFMMRVLIWSYQNRRLLSGMVLLPAVTQYVWFVHSAGAAGYQELVPFFHSLQYMFIAWCMQLKEKQDVRKIPPSRRYVALETGRWGLMIFGLGAVLFFLLPRAIDSVFTLPGPNSLFFASGIIAAGVQIHHFFVDGVIWKLKNKAVSSPLMINVSDLVHPSAPPDQPGSEAAAAPTPSPGAASDSRSAASKPAANAKRRGGKKRRS